MSGNPIDKAINRPTPSPAPQPPGTFGGPPPGVASSPVPSPAPGPSPSAPAGGSGEVRFAPDRIRRIGTAFEQELGEIIKQARYKLNAKPRDVEPGAYTTFGYMLAMMHTEVIEYADQDLITKAKAAMDFNDRLQRTAANQDEGERKSAINGGR